MTKSELIDRLAAQFPQLVAKDAELDERRPQPPAVGALIRQRLGAVFVVGM